MTDQRPVNSAAISFIDCINRRDADGLVALMADPHTMTLFDEPPVTGRPDAHRSGWQSYFDGFPDYVIHPRQIATNGRRVAVLGSTTGSHLALPDEEELALSLIWMLEVDKTGKVAHFQLVPDTSDQRRALGLN